MIICICGSTRFRAEIEAANRDLTIRGYIVLAPGVFGHSGDSMTPQEKVELDDLHLRKIDMAGIVYVVRPGGYIGSSTKREIAYAESRGKAVVFGEALPTDVRVTRDELAFALRQHVGDMTPDRYRRVMDTAPCHFGICTVDNCGRCGRELNALTLLARFDAEKKRASERIEAEIRPLLDLRDAKLDEMDGKKT